MPAQALTRRPARFMVMNLRIGAKIEIREIVMSLTRYALLLSVGLTSCTTPQLESAPRSSILPETDREEIQAPSLSLPFEKHILSNGLRVVLHRDVSDPVVNVTIAYHVGSGRERSGQHGFAHLF